MDYAGTMSQVEEENRAFIRHVYNWMTAGLAVTGAVAWYMVSNPEMVANLVGNRPLFYGLLIGELVLVIYLAGWVKTMTASTAAGVFFFYSALNGVTLSAVFILYTTASLASTFFVAAGTFGVMSVWGYTTKTDLSSVGSFCFMGLIGVILASVANIWLRNGVIYWVTTYVGIAVFVGLTAYDTQKIKAMNVIGNEGTDEDKKEAIAGALSLYLDFINLFLHLLRVMGRRK